MRMFERRRGTRFLLETRASPGIGDEFWGQHLQRDLTVEPDVASAIHVAHSAAAKRRDDLVVAEAIASGQPTERRVVLTQRGGRRRQCNVPRLGHHRPPFRRAGVCAIRREQPFHVLPQCFIAGARGRQKCSPIDSGCSTAASNSRLTRSHRSSVICGRLQSYGSVHPHTTRLTLRCTPEIAQHSVAIGSSVRKISKTRVRASAKPSRCATPVSPSTATL